MNKFRCAIIGIFLALGTVFLGVNSQPTYAVQCNDSFLGFQPWYAGIEMTNCSGGTIDSSKYKDDSGLARLVWTIVLNVMMDISIAIGILATGFIIYGGYLYIFSAGEPGKTEKGKNTIRNAIIGVGIALAAGLIVGTVKTILTAG